MDNSPAYIPSDVISLYVFLFQDKTSLEQFEKNWTITNINFEMYIYYGILKKHLLVRNYFVKCKSYYLEWMSSFWVVRQWGTIDYLQEFGLFPTLLTDLRYNISRSVMEMNNSFWLTLGLLRGMELLIWHQ